MHSARMTKIDSHPVGGICYFSVGCADLADCCFVLGFPRERVVVTSMPEVEKAAGGHLKVERDIERSAGRDWKEGFRVGPHAQFLHGRDQGKPIADVVV